MRRQREAIARAYLAALAALDTLELPIDDPDRILSWHLFPIRLQLERLSIDRNVFFDRLRDAGVSCSVHWRPLHLHPYYEQTFGWQESDCPTASELWPRLISLPIFPDMRRDEIAAVVQAVQDTCRQYTTGSISDAVA
jgi:dTDP-4-amino-4,6-dideoxygalactose transaminase